ncbi:Hypothetical protein NTJ_16243 [Nesidiocoris tenuis]|uniref:Uncharacterized protein n=1 Tax=Nesidiocoris tenuis TaxID=355587 RepID=A0ABN7BHT3_9HEMI|nr:Hypothetical protein NTJ_16243 [Nesidiocoris tenuis]
MSTNTGKMETSSGYVDYFSAREAKFCHRPSYRLGISGILEKFDTMGWAVCKETPSQTSISCRHNITMDEER